MILVDLPGYGASARTVQGAGAPALADGLEGLLDSLRLETVHVAGNSMGGWIALELASRGRARTVTVLSPAGFYNAVEAVFTRISLQVSVRMARLLAPRAARVFASVLCRSVLFAQCMGRPWRLSTDEAAAITQAFAESPYFEADLAAITGNRFAGGADIRVPVTVGWGRRDRLLPPWQGRRAMREIPAARLVSLPGVGHIPTYDDPDLVADLLLRGSDRSVR
ncbi:pimeloyl-ACP methyl ester carboxylesterase [Micromonospora polyrhachis]|uniref:Pimeloyl-ACP methyl ester carboxylesterase n=1 Tax=Micromonospora polyrhachis TaxID=1282883 RepID=A0A7W7SME1_9ACTN|nr:pimeloyl-ACP methyl ester carboxylesterase [Micromonospora polyrhachis]